MKAILSRRLYPLNIFQIHGTMCCPTMLVSFLAKHFLDNFLCYEARSIGDANVLVLWGSFSEPLANLIRNEMERMMENKAIIHIRGCGNRVDNDMTKSALTNTLPISSIFTNCILQPEDASALVHEVRQCLKA